MKERFLSWGSFHCATVRIIFYLAASQRDDSLFQNNYYYQQTLSNL